MNETKNYKYTNHTSDHTVNRTTSHRKKHTHRQIAQRNKKSEA